MEDIKQPTLPGEVSRNGSDDSSSVRDSVPSQTSPSSASPEMSSEKARAHLEPPMALATERPTVTSYESIAPAPSTTVESTKSSKISGLLSHSPIRPLKTRALSSSSSVLARFTSRSSSHQSENFGEPASPTSMDASGDSPINSKLDRASLAKAKGKYKSSVNWENSPINLATGEEPFLVQAAPLQRTDEEIQVALKAQDMEAMAAAGSTKAALAWARANSIGDPIFANHRRILAEASAMTPTSPTSPTSPRSRPVQTRSAIDNGKSSTVRFNGIDDDSAAEISSPVTAPSSPVAVSETIDEKDGKETTRMVNGEGMMAEAAEHFLSSAKNAAANADGVIGFASESPAAGGSTVDASTLGDEVKSSKAKMAKRKTFLNFGGFKKSKAETTISSPEEDANEQRQDELDSRQKDMVPPRPDFEPVNTIGRRRRFNDTRQLNLLASELAAEALLNAPDSYATLPPEARRASMMNLLAASNGDMAASPANGSQISLHGNGNNSSFISNLPLPQPSFVADHARASSQGASSSHSSTPVMHQTDGSRFEPPRAPFARSMHSVSSAPSSPILSQKTNLTGLPHDMLTGLGDGPYPTLPPRGLEIPEVNHGTSSHSDASWDQSSAISRGSLPDQFIRSRGTSASSSSLPKKSVLQMTMFNPEMDLQGLTKPPKSGKTTPFGSRSNSKQVTPVGSFTNLKEKFNASSPNITNGQKAGEGSNGVSNDGKAIEKERSSGEGSDMGTNADAGKRDKLSVMMARRCFFGKKEKPTDSPEPAPSPPLPSYPLPSQMHLSPSPIINGVKGNESPLSRNSAESRSAQNLVKIPSANSNKTTNSVSSRDVNVATSSSDGNSQQQTHSALTTPEALPTKSDSTLPSGAARGAPPSFTAHPLAATSATATNRVQTQNKAARQPPSPPSSTPRPNAIPAPRPLQQKPQNSQSSNMRAPNSRNASTNSKAASIGNNAKLAKFKSMFATKATATPSVPTKPKPVNAVPVKDYGRIKSYSEKGGQMNNTSTPVAANMRKNDSQHSAGQSSGKDGSIYSNASIGALLRKGGWAKEKVA